MRIVSFAWTTPALVAGRKTVTRRKWSLDYAKLFKPGDECYAYDRSPRFGGKPVAVIRIESVKPEPTSTMPDSDYEAEGFAFLDGGKIGNHDATREGFEAWRRMDESMFVIRFKLVRLLGPFVGAAKE